MTPNIRQRRQTKKKKRAKSLPYDSNLSESKPRNLHFLLKSLPALIDKRFPFCPYLIK